MISSRFSYAVMAWIVLGTSGLAFGEELFPVERRLWKPAPDNVYFQETARKIPTTEPVDSVAVYGGVLYAVVNNEVYALKHDKLDLVESAPKGVRSLQTEDASLWALAGTCWALES